jgi:hypothetical protein
MDFYKDSFIKIQEFNASLKESSIKAYLQSIKKLSKELFNSSKPDLRYLKDHESIIE